MITVALGNGKNERFKTQNYFYYYQALKADFMIAHDTWSVDQHPDPADSSNWGDWADYAEKMLLEQDHLFQVATIIKSQIKKFNSAGINTMQELADSSIEHINGINDGVMQRLKAQANIQHQTKMSQESNSESIKPCFQILKPQDGEKIGLALLPPHSKYDVFFDIEGNPLDKGGLEYLWGATYLNENGERCFKDFWAHNQIQEKIAFKEFIEWAYGRWLQDPHMHIYHYANYGIAACRKLMERYGICEYEVDQLLRNEVFVDLYKIIKGGVLLGEPRYSIKNVEHLYRGKRDTEVGNGGDSVVVYEQWRELNEAGEEGDTWQTSKILKDIRDYNIDDCDSTQELVDWLRQQQDKHGIQYLGKLDVIEPEQKEEVTKRTQLRDRLLKSSIIERESDPLKALLTENMAWVLEFHRRESKPVFWRLFERMGLSHIELLDDLDCLACCERTCREPFKPTSRARNLAYEYRFDVIQEFKASVA